VPKYPDLKSLYFILMPAYNQLGSALMRSPDVPEVLIALGLVATLLWAIYNWVHRQDARR